MIQSCCIAYSLLGELRHFADYKYLEYETIKTCSKVIKMECNIEEIGGQIVESSNGKTVNRATLKDEKEWQYWVHDFQLKSNSAWVYAIRSVMQQSYIQEGLYLSTFIL